MEKTRAIPHMGTIKEASELSGMSYNAIRSMCINGKIIHVKAGTKYLINLDKLAEYLDIGDKPGEE